MSYLITPRGFAEFSVSGTLTHPAPGKLIHFKVHLIGGGGGGSGWTSSFSFSNGTNGGNTVVSNGVDTVTAVGGAGGGISLRASGTRRVFAPYSLIALNNYSIDQGTAVDNLQFWIPSIGNKGRGGVSQEGNGGGTIHNSGEHGQELISVISSYVNLTVTVGAGGAGGGGNYNGQAGNEGIVIIEW